MLSCPLQAIITCPILTDIAPGGAGTVVKIGSHLLLAHAAARAGEDGPDHATLCKMAQEADPVRFPESEICSAAGDVLLLHPYLAHSSTSNVHSGSEARVSLALTKRAYWITDASWNAGLPIAPVELPLAWALTNRKCHAGDERLVMELQKLTKSAVASLRSREDHCISHWKL